MRLPNADQAEVPREKITDYLLAQAHRSGRAKAIFFLRVGFEIEKWAEIAAALQQHAIRNDVAGTIENRFGTRFRVEGPLLTPKGQSVHVRTIWFIESGTHIPRLVTAYPLRSQRGSG